MGWLSDDLCLNILFVLEKGCFAYFVRQILGIYSPRCYDTGLYDFISDSKHLKHFFSFKRWKRVAYNNFKANGIYRKLCTLYGFVLA